MAAMRSTAHRRRRADAAVNTIVARIRPRAEELLGADDAEAFLARLEQVHVDLFEPLDVLYGERTDTAALLGRLVGIALEATGQREPALRRLDRRREIDPGWFRRARVIGYVTYVDRFAETIAGIRKRLDYLGELGITYLHLMPLLEPREGENDGGYAVADYRRVDPRLGSNEDLQALAADLHARGMSLCVDFVLNHTAQEHEWARAAAAGDPHYRDFYYVFPDRQLPDAYEQTLLEIFPDNAPGSFTHVDGLGWVWTTFHHYQWDLNYTNPDVFAAMLETLLHVVNLGVDVVRLDAVPFTWKRMGTICQNQPEAHLILQALRALARVATPGVIFKAEAIVSPDELVQYLGAHDRFRPECDLAYNNQLMVMLWSSLAARDGRLISTAMSRLRRPPATTGWVTYVRCHDDIGWAVSDQDAGSLGWNGFWHRRFLNDFYAGRHPGSFARGALFQENPATGDARVSGMAAALCGIEAARESGDPVEVEAAVRRLVLLYSVAYSYGGIPLVYMGDEIALGNDPHWAEDPRQAPDNRWMHRPFMDWAAAERRHEQGSVEEKVFAALRDLGAARRDLITLRAEAGTEVLHVDNPHVFAYARHHPRAGHFVAIANFSDSGGSVHSGILSAAGLHDPQVVHASEPHPGVSDWHIPLQPWGFVWFTDG